jgi:multidrug efflux pump subunit AcrA (membrane-fusion protein)
VTAAVAVLAVITILAVAALVWRDRAARAATDMARRRLARADARVGEAESRAANAEGRARRLEDQRASAAVMMQASADRVLQADARLAVARRQAEAERSALEGLWKLAVIEGRRDWQLTMAQAGPGGPVAATTLADTLSGDVDRIREETGTPGSIRSALAAEPGAAESVITLRAVQALLAVLARYCDAYDLQLSGDGGKLVATLTCERFQGGETVLADASSVAEAVGPCGGNLDLRQDAGGRLHARLSLPGRLYPTY